MFTPNTPKEENMKFCPNGTSLSLNLIPFLPDGI